MSFKKKIAIIGPFNTRGGREIEAGFIADVLEEDYQVTIFSLANINKANDINLVNHKLSIYTKSTSFSSKLKNKLGIKVSNSDLAFKCLKSRKTKQLNTVIKEHDVIFIIAQVLSLHIPEIVALSKAHKKKVILRTTGTIPLLRREYKGVKYDLSFLENIDEYIHHTTANADSLNRILKHNYSIVDQSVFNESELKSVRHQRKLIRKFYTCSRLDKNKNITAVIKAFNAVKNNDLELHIYGDGYEMNALKTLKENKNIYFYGHVDYNQLIDKINDNDCLIISSKEEAGPYTGLEAMCLGIPVISTPVGSMPIRFKEFDTMWFNYNDEKTLIDRINYYSSFKPAIIANYQHKLEANYDVNYNKKLIKSQYLNIVKKHIN
jgi:glycosyltransferase involved in cell wall biosynthesis